MNVDRSKLLETLSLQPLLAGLPAENREVLAGLGTLATCPVGAFLTEEATAVSSLWFLAEGRLNVEVGHGASRTSLTVLEAGSLVGEACYLTGRHR
jgi:hypothetical protein